MISNDDMLSSALGVSSMGYYIFPCIPGAKEPLTHHGLTDASNEESQVERWWAEYPSANIALRTDALIVIDIDGANNEWLQGDDRRASLFSCPVQTTPRGGTHHIFRQPPGREWRNTTSRLADHVDTRANGGYILLSPSVVGDKAYEWQYDNALSQSSDKIPLPPSWLIDLLDGIHNAKSEPSNGTGNDIPAGQRNDTLARLAGNMRRVGMTQAEIRVALQQTNIDRCNPSLPEREVDKIAESVSRYEPDQIAVAVAENHYAQIFNQDPSVLFRPIASLCTEITELHKPVIHGLLRESETMNIISSPKVGKSWAVLNFAIALAIGAPWLTFKTEKGKVLLLDNELHEATLSFRSKAVSQAMEVPIADTISDLFYKSLRGELKDIRKMEAYFMGLPPNFFKVIILDAFYRFIPEGVNENDNAAIASLYNLLDRIAKHLNTAFILIHHASKGNQSGKAITDVGSGAQAGARAADCHLILRPHKQDDCLIVDAEVRSWKKIAPFVIRKNFPLWIRDDTMDATELKQPEGRGKRDPQAIATIKRSNGTNIDPASFVREFVSVEPQREKDILIAARNAGVSKMALENVLWQAKKEGLLFERITDRGHKAFSTVDLGSRAHRAKIGESAKDSVKRFILENPDLSTREVEAKTGVDKSLVSRLRNELKRSGESLPIA